MEYIQPIVGFFILLLLGAIFSENIKAIKVRYLVSAVVIQVLLALMCTKLFSAQLGNVISFTEDNNEFQMLVADINIESFGITKKFAEFWRAHGGAGY